MNDNSDHWKKKADRSWGALIHCLYDKCWLSDIGDLPCVGPLHAHHLIRKAALATRFDPLNGMLLCEFHHENWSKSPHNSKKEFMKIVNIHAPSLYAWIAANKHRSFGGYSFRETHEKLQALIHFANTGFKDNIIFALRRYLSESFVDSKPSL